MRRGPRNVRTWSDEQLTAALASEHTWRAVARRLGLAPGSTNNLRRHARRLGLDTSHFKYRKRTWSDDDLRRVVPTSATWTEVSRRLGLSETGRGRSAVVARARSLGLDVAGPKVPGRTKVLAGEPALDQLSAAAERLAVTWFALRGVPVSVPVGPQAYDLLATLPDGVKRVQVKSTTYRGKAGTWRVGVGQRPYVHDKSAQRLPYDPEDLDYYFIVDGDGVLYLIPSSVLGGRTAINVGPYEAYRVGDASSLLAVVPERPRVLGESSA